MYFRNLLSWNQLAQSVIRPIVLETKIRIIKTHILEYKHGLDQSGVSAFLALCTGVRLSPTMFL